MNERTPFKKQFLFIKSSLNAKIVFKKKIYYLSKYLKAKKTFCLNLFSHDFLNIFLDKNFKHLKEKKEMITPYYTHMF